MLKLINKTGCLNFTVRKVEAMDIAKLPEIKEIKTDGKSPSQRLRAAIFGLHEQRGGKKEDFEAYYSKVMEKFIDDVKGRMDQ